jgi:hypothetical protein
MLTTHCLFLHPLCLQYVSKPAVSYQHSSSMPCLLSVGCMRGARITIAKKIMRNGQDENCLCISVCTHFNNGRIRAARALASRISCYDLAQQMPSSPPKIAHTREGVIISNEFVTAIAQNINDNSTRLLFSSMLNVFEHCFHTRFTRFPSLDNQVSDLDSASL